jgi:hypothetical protein
MLTKGERRRPGRIAVRPWSIHGPGIEEAKEVTHDEKVERLEITALSTASVSGIDNMSDIITGFCD